MKRLGILVLTIGLTITTGGVPWPRQDFRSPRDLGSLSRSTFAVTTADVQQGTTTEVITTQRNAELPGLEPAQSSCVAVGIGMLADVNDDGLVNVDDVQLAALRWRDPNQYAILYDVVPDEVINVLDIAQIAAAWGSACPLRFVDNSGAPLAGTTVRVLCYEPESATPSVADLRVETNAFGRPVQGLPVGCSQVAALHLRHEQPSGKPGHGPAYQVYATSWPPGSRELWPINGTVPIRDDWLLVLFHVVASLEWEPADHSRFVSDLEQGLRSASAYLYDLTDGQMALGPVELYTGGRAWDAADLRFRAANDYRPSAHVGGIVAKPLPYAAPLTELEIVYAPGEVYLGRFWDGLEAADPIAGRWSEPVAYRTLVHEWAHYALFLYDEYQDTDINGDKTWTYCTCLDLDEVGTTPGACGGVSPDLAASAMAYHYTASELWLDGEPPVCLGTDQWWVHGEPDWETLSRWSLIQGLGPGLLQKPITLGPGPSDLGLAGDLFAFRAGGSSFATSEITVTLKIDAAFDAPVLNTLYPQVYVVEGPAESPNRIVYQGTTVGGRSLPNHLGEITLLGVPETGALRVYVDRYATSETPGVRFVYPSPGSDDPPPVSNHTLLLKEDPWHASLDVTYGMTGSLLTTMTVTLSSPDVPSAAPIARLCVPDADIGCPNDPAWHKTMNAVDNTTWTTTFTTPKGTELPHYGVLQVQAPDVGELVRWFQVAGGVGPAHMDAEAPLRDGLVMVDTVEQVPGENSRVIIMPAADYDQLMGPLPAGIQETIGAPLDVDILLPAPSSANVAGGGRPSRQTDPTPVTPADQTLPVPVVLTFFYGQEVVDRLGIDENQLRVLHFKRAKRAWEPVQVSEARDSVELNWLTTGPVTEDGIYAVGWTAGP